MSQPTNNPIATQSHIIQFHGLYLIVRKHQDIEYITLKPIIESIGIDWRGIKRNLENYDNQELYGAKVLICPKTDVFLQHMSQNSPVESAPTTHFEQKNEQKDQFSEDFCIRLDRVEMFLARINTAKVRSAGNERVADYLLGLQQEWADALHSYENYGIAMNKSMIENDKHTKLLFDMYRMADDKNHKALLAKRIDKALAFRRLKGDDDQPDMFG